MKYLIKMFHPFFEISGLHRNSSQPSIKPHFTWVSIPFSAPFFSKKLVYHIMEYQEIAHFYFAFTQNAQHGKSRRPMRGLKTDDYINLPMLGRVKNQTYINLNNLLKECLRVSLCLMLHKKQKLHI